MQNEFMQEAIRLAHKGIQQNQGGPFGAVVIKNDKIIGRGFNQVLATCDPTAHAEVIAIREACRQLQNYSLQGAEIYTSCEPCPMCLSAIYWARIDKIYYAASRHDAKLIGFDDEFFYEEISKSIETRAIPMQQFSREEALLVFKIWKSKPDKIVY